MFLTCKTVQRHFFKTYFALFVTYDSAICVDFSSSYEDVLSLFWFFPCFQ